MNKGFMKKIKSINYVCVLTLSAVFALAVHLPSFANITFMWSDLPIVGGEDSNFHPSGSALFNIEGAILKIILTNDTAQTIVSQYQVLTGLTWGITDADVILTPVSAVVHLNSGLVYPSGSWGDDLSGEWAFKSNISAGSLGPLGISAVGSIDEPLDSFGPGDRFNTDPILNIFSPPPKGSLNGIDGGIVGPSVIPTGGFLNSGPVVQGDSNTAGQMIFSFNISGTLADDEFTNVQPLFGSAGKPLVPEPASLLLLGSGLLGLAGVGFRKKHKV